MTNQTKDPRRTTRVPEGMEVYLVRFLARGRPWAMTRVMWTHERAARALLELKAQPDILQVRMFRAVLTDVTADEPTDPERNRWADDVLGPVIWHRSSVTDPCHNDRDAEGVEPVADGPPVEGLPLDLLDPARPAPIAPAISP